MPSERTRSASTDPNVADYRHTHASRKNNPPAGLAAQGKVKEAPKHRYEYNPHLPPVLRFDPTGKSDALPELLAEARNRPLTEEETRLLADALRNREPWLEWAGKREAQACETDPVALHIHERVSAQAILRVAARQDIPRTLFADPEQEYREAVQFYQHDVAWSNRLILGDALQVMASLTRREDLAGKVQMIYMDPPYGIKFGSNFQSEIGKRDVKDRVEDLTREVETIKAYRDTWNLGVHSYLTYLRDRLSAAKELLADTGSIFVQISDENLHRVRAVLDEVFGVENFIGLIAFVTTGGQSADRLGNVFDFLIWYGRDTQKTKYNQLYDQKELREGGGWAHSRIEFEDGRRENVGVTEVKRLISERAKVRPYSQDGIASQGATSSGSEPILFNGRRFPVPANSHWKTSVDGMQRLAKCNRIEASENSIRYVRFIDDFPVQPYTNIWDDTNRPGYIDSKRYVVQTSSKVIERCLLMTTDPGDLVLDPTCGSGTSAYVAEQWGRRWISIDTSRVALSIARQRLLTAKFDCYRMRPITAQDMAQNPNGLWLRDPLGNVEAACTFSCKTVPHITLKSIAQNRALDPIFGQWEPVLADKLTALNAVLADVTLDLRNRLKWKLAEKEKREGKKSITDADRRRWLLPETVWKDWEVPFDTDPEWSESLQTALTDYRQAWRQKMDAVNQCIAASAEQEELVDKPEIVRNVLRVSGPFTVEGVRPAEESLDLEGEAFEGFEGEPEELETFDTSETGNDLGTAPAESVNAEAYLDRMVRLLRADAVRFPNNREMKFTRLETLSDECLHAEGEWEAPTLPEENEASPGHPDMPSLIPKRESLPEGSRLVAVVFGPQYGPLTADMVEDSLHRASRRGYDDLVFAAFSFDAAAQGVIQDDPNPRIRCHMAHIRPDVNMGDLLKTTPGSQLFTVSGLPRVELGCLSNGEYTVTMEGVDLYNPVDNTVLSAGPEDVAAWFLDADYDGHTFCICQAFFPNKKAWESLSKALTGVVDADRFAALSGTKSLPFPAGKHRKAAVKAIDPRGNEVLRVLPLTRETKYA